MKTLLCLFLLTAGAYGQATFAECEQELIDLKQCHKALKPEKPPKPQLPKLSEQEKQDLRDSIRQCFTDNGCEDPLPSEDEIAAKQAEKEARRNCRKGAKKAAKEKLEVCMQNKIPGFRMPEKPQRPERPGGHGPNPLKMMRKLAHKLEEVCDGDEEIDDVQECIQNAVQQYLPNLPEGGEGGFPTGGPAGGFPGSGGRRRGRGGSSSGAQNFLAKIQEKCEGHQQCVEQMSEDCVSVAEEVVDAMCDCGGEIADDAEQIKADYEQCLKSAGIEVNEERGHGSSRRGGSGRGRGRGRGRGGRGRGRGRGSSRQSGDSDNDDDDNSGPPSPSGPSRFNRRRFNNSRRRPGRRAGFGGDKGGDFLTGKLRHACKARKLQEMCDQITSGNFAGGFPGGNFRGIRGRQRQNGGSRRRGGRGGRGRGSGRG